MSRFISARLVRPSAAAGMSLMLVATPALACPICYGASNPRTLHAFYISTVALTLMPIMLIAAFAIWISRAYNKPEIRRGQPTARTRLSAER